MDKAVSLVFPRDHRDHPDFSVEWWYLAGFGRDENFKPVNYHFALFRKRNFYFAHFGLNVDGVFEFQERVFKDVHIENVNGLLQFYIEDWDFHIVEVKGIRFVLRLGEGTSIVHIARKRPSIHDPSYYSVTSMDVQGTIGGKAFKAQGWFDHRFFNASTEELLSLKYIWLALQLDTGIEIMLEIRPNSPPESLGSINFPGDEIQKIRAGDYCLRHGESFQGWTLELPTYGMEFDLRKKTKQEVVGQWGPPYTEGTFEVFSRTKIGQGFFEITRGGLKNG